MQKNGPVTNKCCNDSHNLAVCVLHRLNTSVIRVDSDEFKENHRLHSDEHSQPNHDCHSERSEESPVATCGFFAALRMTGKEVPIQNSAELLFSFIKLYHIVFLYIAINWLRQEKPNV